MEVGYKNYRGTGPSWNGLASEEFELISITIDDAARDTGNINTDDLRAGLAMERDSTTGKYVQFISDHDSLVILAENVYDLADYGDQIAKAYWSGSFKKGAVIEPATVTWSSAQRFRIRAGYQ